MRIKNILSCFVTAMIAISMASCDLLSNDSNNENGNGNGGNGGNGSKDDELAYVDMGLSVKWAKFNIGASKPEEYGDLYAWGEKTYYYKDGQAHNSNPEMKADKPSGYNDVSYCFYAFDIELGASLTKYTEKDGKKVLEDADDVASITLKETYRIPTAAEWQELIDNCTVTKTSVNGVSGIKMTSKKSGYTDKSIFLPFGGYFKDQSLWDFKTMGNYWTATLDDTKEYMAKAFCATDEPMIYGCQRAYGLSIRPVCK